MTIIKCKMCGGDMDISEGMTVAVCEYCGTKQTIPSADNEKKLTLFARANRLRMACEFDKAAGVYESIVAEFPEEAEAYWGLVLCRYGIEYVDDPATGKKIPTCHRSSFDSILEDDDFEQACENADVVARKVYREEAKAIEDIRRGILEVSGREEPYDIFICYKETDENGERTIDSVIAQDVYGALTEKNYRVFFSRITLEDKLGTEYEPYIFAALNSAKVMLVFGTDYEYFNAVWVKNEWSRFLSLIAAGQKKTLIPCYKDVDAYDMPKEFRRLQAQDMGKVGAIQDLLRGIEKILGKSVAAQVSVASDSVATSGVAVPGVEALLKRGYIFLKDGEWKKADEYFEKVLDIDPENGESYAGKLCAELHYYELSDMTSDDAVWYQNKLEKDGGVEKLYAKVMRYAGEELKQKIKEYRDAANEIGREKEREKEKEREERRAVVMIAAGYHYTVGLRADGSVLAVGNNKNGECDVSAWRDVVAVAAGESHTVGLCADGSVLAVGDNWYGQCKVFSWRDIVAVAVGKSYTVGLRKDGSVLAVGDNWYGQCKVSSWRDIVAIAAGKSYTVGLCADGSVLSAGDNESGQCDVSAWRDIVAIAAGSTHTVGLCGNGSVLAVGSNEDGECNVSVWRDIVTIAAGCHYTVGLRADGSVLAVGNNKNGECDVSAWRDVVAVVAGESHTVGLCKDGSVLVAGCNNHGQCDIGTWKLFNRLDTLEQERAEARVCRAAEEV